MNSSLLGELAAFGGRVRRVLIPRRIFFLRLLWGSHRKEFGLSESIVEEFVESGSVQLSILDPIIRSHEHFISFPPRRTFLMRDVQFDRTTGLLWAKSGPLVESATYFDARQIGKRRINLLRAKKGSAQNPPIFPIKKESFYHWVVETVPRMIRALERYPDCEIRHFGPIENFQEQYLRLLGRVALPVRRIHQRRSITAVCPTVGQLSGWPHPSDISALRASIPLSGEDNGLPPKIFLSRIGSSRRLKNSEEISRFLSQNGFVEVNMANLPVTQQIEMISNAAFIVAEHGGALANLAFARAGTRVLELMLEEYANPCFEMLSLHVGLRYARVVVTNRTCSLEAVSQEMTLLASN